ncbi:MAG: hypothetical protein WC763_05740 [Candidatus Paceibacterota bacterium]|jgi:hypothetical protein
MTSLGATADGNNNTNDTEIEMDSFSSPSSFSFSSSPATATAHFDPTVVGVRDDSKGDDVYRRLPAIDESDAIAYAMRIAAARTRTIMVYDFTRARDALENGTTMSMHVIRFVVPSHRPRLADLQVLSREIQRKLELEHETFTALLAGLSSLTTSSSHCTTTAAVATIARAVRLKLANTLAQSALSLIDPGGTLELNAYFRKLLMPSFSHRRTPIYRAAVELLEDMAIAFEADDDDDGGGESGAQRDKIWTLVPELAINHHLNAFSLYSFAWYYHYSIGVREKYERKATLALTRAFLSASSILKSLSSSSVSSAASVIPAHAGCVLLAASIKDEAKRNSLIGKCKELSAEQQVLWMGELTRITLPPSPQSAE